MEYDPIEPPQRPKDFEFQTIKMPMGFRIALLVLVLLLIGPFAFWFGFRVEAKKGQFVPLMRKTGKNIMNKDVLAPTSDFKGPQHQFRKEGRHFLNPYTWHWPEPISATVIPQLQVGIQIRRYGEPLERGQVVVRNEKQKGILPKPLGPGRHYVNTWAYDVTLQDMVKIEPGYMGVVTRMVGDPPDNPNVFVVGEGERGTQPFLLQPGTHPDYSNPYVHMVTPIDVRSQKFEMSGQFGITFPSKYGFDIHVEGTIEWAPDIKKLPELFVKYVDEKDLVESGGINNIQRKVILPFARSYFRMVGGQYRAVDYITGDTRISVQKEVERRLAASCAEEGILVRSFVIRATEPPRQIREQYERREIAMREIDQFKKEVEMEVGTVVIEGATATVDEQGNPILDERGAPVMIGGTAKLDPDGRQVREGGRLAKVIQERQKDRESKFGRVREEIVTMIRDAERYQAVEVTKGERDFEVAKIMLEAAKDRAAKTLAEGQAHAEVAVMKHQAEAQAVRAKIKAFGTGEMYAEYQLITKFAPGIRQVLSNTEGLFAELFERFAKAKSDK